MKKIIEFFKLCGLRCVVMTRSLIEFLKVIYFYYSNREFAKIDITLLRYYLPENPYRMARKHLEKLGEAEVHKYGETPLTTLEVIAQECHLDSADKVYELGSGRGRSCFWLRYFVGCDVTGIEFVPDFVHISQKITRDYGVEGVEFLCSDIMDVDFSDATAVYFYGTCSDNEFIQRLCEKLESTRSGTKVITVSYPLTLYTAKPIFKLVKSFPAMFLWGTTTVYLQVRR